MRGRKKNGPPGKIPPDGPPGSAGPSLWAVVFSWACYFFSRSLCTRTHRKRERAPVGAQFNLRMPQTRRLPLYAGHKKTPGWNDPIPSHRRVKSRNLPNPPLYNSRRKEYNISSNARLCRCVWRCALHMQGAGCWHALSLLCTFYCALPQVYPRFLQNSTIFYSLNLSRDRRRRQGRAVSFQAVRRPEKHRIEGQEYCGERRGTAFAVQCQKIYGFHN